MSQSLGLTVLTLAFIITYVSAACPCPNRTSGQRFCNDDFAIVFKIEKSGIVEGLDRVFKVKLLSRYRTVRSKVLDDVEKLYTPAEAACGVILIPDAYYIVSGNYTEKPGQDTQLRIDKCSLLLYFANDPRDVYLPPDCITT